MRLRGFLALGHGLFAQHLRQRLYARLARFVRKRPVLYRKISS